MNQVEMGARVEPAAKPKPRLWVLPWGLYPRRVTIYLKEKGILDHFDVIPVDVTTNGMAQVPGKPPGSMPILEIGRPRNEKDNGRYIRQSTAILEYLEDEYGFGSETPDMRGGTSEERARVRDCMSVLNEACEFFGMYCHNASKLFEGMEEQSTEAAKKCLERSHHLLGLLEDIAVTEGPWLTSQGYTPTIVDCVAMALIQFSLHAYEYDLTAGHPRLRELYDAFVIRDSAAMEEIPQFARELGPILSTR